MNYLRRNGIALVALVFAMSGTGLAASRVLITNIHQISPSVVRQLRAGGKQGAQGPEGKEGVQKVTLVGVPGVTGPAGVPGAIFVEPVKVQGYPGKNVTPQEVKEAAQEYLKIEVARGCCIGPVGPRGPTGPAGGPTGPTGPTGAP